MLNILPNRDVLGMVTIANMYDRKRNKWCSVAGSASALDYKINYLFFMYCHHCSVDLISVQ